MIEMGFLTLPGIHLLFSVDGRSTQVILHLFYVLFIGRCKSSFLVEAAGGKALPCLVDIRDEEAVNSSVEQTVRKFGGIDILVNNASAISLTGTLETPMKK